jgi:uncharacterized protein YndB with AHSA1/START domain
MTLIISAIVIVLIVGLLGVAASKPNTFNIQRTKSIKAPPEKIFPLISDFHAWDSWSPFEKLDPAMKKSYSGSPSGVGAVYEWEGKGKAGKGRMEIADVAEPSRVTIKLHFIKPFECHNTAEFTLVPKADSTEVTWAMHGPASFMGKLMSVFMSMDSMVGKDFEEGLESIKRIAEG